MYSPVCVGVKIFSTFLQNSVVYLICNSKNVLYIVVIDIGNLIFFCNSALNFSNTDSEIFFAFDNNTFSKAEWIIGCSPSLMKSI